jgi:hypothetical protein
MQINRNIKEDKYLLIIQKDGSIVFVGSKKQIPRLKSGNENAGWNPVSLSGSSQNVGMALMSAMKYYLNNDGIATLNDLINMSSGNFSPSNYTKSGTFTYQGYTYTWFIDGYCQANNLPNDCWASVISGPNCTDYQNGQQGGIYKLKGIHDAPIMSIHSSQAGSYTALSNYMSN